MPNFNKHKSRATNLLTVVGYRCRIFPIDHDTLKAETLVPWMNDPLILIDKYDARCWLTEIGSECPTKEKFVEDSTVELLCDEERYLDLRISQQQQQQQLATNNNINNNNSAVLINEAVVYPNIESIEDDCEQRKKKMINVGEFTAVNFSYDENKVVEKEYIETDPTKEIEEDIPYQCPADLIIPDNIELPKTEKQAAKIEKTAAFIANNGIQMEILLKTKQSNNDQFEFLSFDNELNPFYKFLLEKIKNAEYIPARRHLCHLTKREDDNAGGVIENINKNNMPKIDITNTAYYKLINKYKSDTSKVPAEPLHNDNKLDCTSTTTTTTITSNNNSSRDNSDMTTEETPTVDSQVSDQEEAATKFYTTLYEQYYTFYYNYYHQLQINHNTSSQCQDSSNNIQSEEDCKALAINAAAYAAKAGVDQYQKEQEEKTRQEELKVEKANKKKQHCIILKYVDNLLKYGSDFECFVNSNSAQLKFLDPENLNHNFYQQRLKRGKQQLLLSSSSCQIVETKIEENLVVEQSFPKWEDYVKLTVESNDSKTPSKLLSEDDSSKKSEEEERLCFITDMISGLRCAEKIGREKSVPATVDSIIEDVKASRKRKATEFMEKIRETKSAKVSESEKSEKRSKKSKKSHSSKKRKHRH